MDRDLLPWILGAALIAGGAIAAALQYADRAPSPSRTVTASLPVPGIAATAVSPVSGTDAKPHREMAPPVAAPPAADAGPSMPSADSAPPTKVSADDGAELPTGQVWQCLENGQKVFSDKRCGRDASVRQLSTLNTMEATPALPGSYGAYPYGAPPAYGAYPYGAPPRQDDPDGYGDAGGEVYSGPLYLAARDRLRREHHRHHDDPPRQPPPSRGAGPSRNLR